MLPGVAAILRFPIADYDDADYDESISSFEDWKQFIIIKKNIMFSHVMYCLFSAKVNCLQA